MCKHVPADICPYSSLVCKVDDPPRFSSPTPQENTYSLNVGRKTLYIMQVSDGIGFLSPQAKGGEHDVRGVSSEFPPTWVLFRSFRWACLGGSLQCPASFASSLPTPCMPAVSG